MASFQSTGDDGWSTTPPPSLSFDLGSPVVRATTTCTTNDSKTSVDFDFDGFTLESVQRRKRLIEQDVFGMSACLSSSVGCTIRDQQRENYHAFYYGENFKPNPLSSSTASARTASTTEDLELSRLPRHHSFQHRLVSTRSEHSTMKRGVFQLSPTAAAAGFPMAKKKQLTAVVMQGWLQKRKRLALRRWKPYYCLFKSDDSLCLYASEDTVNGRLEERYQVLRVVLTDKNDSFHIIGVDDEGSPRREELRASVSTEWKHWSQVFGRFYDKWSMEQALVWAPKLKAFTDAEMTDLVASSSSVSLNNQS